MDRIGPDVAEALAHVGSEGAAASAMPEIVEAWADAVGATIARNAWPARIARDGTLHVATESSAWAFELKQLESDIVRRLREAVGARAPARLRFAPGRLPEAGRSDADVARRRPPQPSPEDRELAAALVAGIDDSDLRDLVARAAAQSLARAAADRPF